MRSVATLAGALLALSLFASGPARALQITLAGPGTAPRTAGIAVEDPLVGSTITFTIGLDAAAAIQGYDVTIAWDASELSLLAASELSGIGFSLAPAGASPGGERVAAIAAPSLPAVATAVLFSVTFAVDAVIPLDGADFRVLVDPAVNGGGIAPGALGPIANPAGAGIAIPEPGPWAFLLAAGACLALGRGPLRTRRTR